MSVSMSNELAFALRAVRRASDLVELIQAEMVSPALTKDDRSPVTVADFASQSLVARLLQQAFPQDVIVGEEAAHALRSDAEKHTLEQITAFVARILPGCTSDDVCRWIDLGGAEPASRFWTLDPIDGTKGFLRKDQYAVALALIEDGLVQIGVLGCPNLRLDHLDLPSLPPGFDPQQKGLLFFAQRGQGSWLLPMHAEAEPVRLSVSSQADPLKARILRSLESGHTNVDQIDLFAQALGIQAEPVRMDSQAKYAVQAAGGGEIYLRLLSPKQPNYKEKIWDQAAGSLVIEEAGGKVTDLDGKPLDFRAGRSLAHNRGILATNAVLHLAALQALRQVNA